MGGKKTRFVELMKKELGKGKKLRASLESLALKYKGEVKVKKLLKLEVSRNLTLPVPAGEAVVSVSPGTDKSPPVTKLEIKFQCPPQVKFSIFNENFFTRVAAKMGMQDIAIGDPEFDRRFMLRSHNVSFLKDLLDNDTRKWIIDIDGLVNGKSRGAGINVSLDKNKLIVRKAIYLVEEVLLDTFINRSFRIYGQLILKLKKEGNT